MKRRKRSAASIRKQRETMAAKRLAKLNGREQSLQSPPNRAQEVITEAIDYLDRADRAGNPLKQKALLDLARLTLKGEL